MNNVINTEAIVAAAMSEFVPTLEANYIDHITRTHAAIVKSLGEEMEGVYNSWVWARTFRMSVAPNLVNYSTPNSGLSQTRLEANAKLYAQQTVESLQGKIVAKLGSVESVEIKRMNGCTFNINGVMNGQTFCIEQTVIVKCSTKGLVFNQFPARIYLNGKFISEAAFKKLQAV